MPFTEINVHPGGRLILVNCLIRYSTVNVDPCYASLSGFFVLGNSSKGQYLSRHTPFDPSNLSDFTDVSRYDPDQAVLIASGCTFQELYGTNLNDYNTIVSTDGGCVELFNCSFVNNYYPIKISDYTNQSQHVEKYNAFNIINCTFKATDTSAYGVEHDNVGNRFIRLNNVKGVQIEGCRFFNYMSYFGTNGNASSRSVLYGIFYDRATFYIQRSGFNRLSNGLEQESRCPVYNLSFSRKNMFHGLPYGIFTNNGCYESSFSVTDCEFRQCPGGIVIRDATKGVIARNNYKFNNHSYHHYLLEVPYVHGYEMDGGKPPIGGLSTTAKNMAFFACVESSKGVIVTENSCEITAKDFPVTGGTENIKAFFVGIFNMVENGPTDKVKVYRNNSGGNNYLGNPVNGKFACGGGRNPQDYETHGVIVTNKYPLQLYFDISCNDFYQLSHPISLSISQAPINGNDNDNHYLQNEGDKAAMNAFDGCGDPAINRYGNMQKSLIYRYLSSDPSHDPGNLRNPISKETAGSYNCSSLPCDTVAWGSGMAPGRFRPDLFSVRVYPNPATGLFRVEWTNASGLKNLHYEVWLYNDLGQGLGHQVCLDCSGIDVALPRHTGPVLGRVLIEGIQVAAFTCINE
jgi:hypothetical protein